MAVMKVMMLLLLLLFNFSFPASFAPLTNNFYSGKPPEKMKDDSNGSTMGGGNGIVNQSKFVLAGGRGGDGSGGEGSNGSGGQAKSSPQGGGAAGIPVYAAAGAGAPGQRESHNGAADICSRKARLLILIATALLLHTSI